MAWRRLGFDRRYILAYSRNADPGPITARLEGLRAEVKEVFRLWNSLGQFALLHDLTNCLRIGDLTVFGGTAPEVRDVKSNPARRLRPAQLRRMNQALEFRPIKDKTRIHFRVITPEEKAAKPKRGGRPRKNRS